MTMPRGKGFTKGTDPRRNLNPPRTGRKPIPPDIKLAFRELTPDAIEVLTQILRNKKAPTSARIRTAEVILERGWGKVAQELELMRPAVVIIDDIPNRLDRTDDE